MTSPKMTRISIRTETRNLLRKIGSKTETYDQVICELIERGAELGLDSRWNRILDEEDYLPLSLM
jgi:hypothetical protein